MQLNVGVHYVHCVTVGVIYSHTTCTEVNNMHTRRGACVCVHVRVHVRVCVCVCACVRACARASWHYVYICPDHLWGDYYCINSAHFHCANSVIGITSMWFNNDTNKQTSGLLQVTLNYRTVGHSNKGVHTRMWKAYYTLWLYSIPGTAGVQQSWSSEWWCLVGGLVGDKSKN